MGFHFKNTLLNLPAFQGLASKHCVSLNVLVAHQLIKQLFTNLRLTNKTKPYE